MWSYCTIKFCLKNKKIVFLKKDDQRWQNFPYELKFPWEKQYLKLHKIKTDKDFAIFFFFSEKPKNVFTFQKFVFKEVLENMKKYFFPSLGTMCTRNFLYIFTKEGLAGENLGRIKEWIFANVYWKVVEQTNAFTRNMSFYNFPK